MIGHNGKLVQRLADTTAEIKCAKLRAQVTRLREAGILVENELAAFEGMEPYWNENSIYALDDLRAALAETDGK